MAEKIENTPQNQYNREDDLYPVRESWIKAHLTLIFIIAGVLIVGLVFFGIHYLNRMHNPASRFVSSSAKNLSTSFSYDIEAAHNDEVIMSYSGAMETDPSGQVLRSMYDADYVDYTYTNVVYTEDGIAYQGNYYNGQWTLSTCTDRVHDFFDFLTDYRRGSIDAAAMLRFTELTSKYTAGAMGSFLNKVMDRMSTGSTLAEITTTYEGDVSVYTYDINLEGVYELIREQGASIFVTVDKYDEFCDRYAANKDIIRDAQLTVTYRVGGEGYMRSLAIELNADEDTYTISCEMSDFNNASPKIPDDFFEAASLRNPNKDM